MFLSRMKQIVSSRCWSQSPLIYVTYAICVIIIPFFNNSNADCRCLLTNPIKILPFITYPYKSDVQIFSNRIVNRPYCSPLSPLNFRKSLDRFVGPLTWSPHLFRDIDELKDSINGEISKIPLEMSVKTVNCIVDRWCFGINHADDSSENSEYMIPLILVLASFWLILNIILSDSVMKFYGSQPK